MTIYTLGHDGRFKEDILSLLRSANLLPGKIVHFHFPGFYYTPKMKIKKKQDSRLLRKSCFRRTLRPARSCFQG